ncbi:MAG: hypothetical protein RR942_15070 [Romboutsia sp.]
MKLPLIQRKKYDAIQNKNLKLIKDKANLECNLDEIKLDYRSLMEEVIALKNDLTEKNNHIESLDKQINLAADFNDRAININCELTTKLAAAEKKIADLEFCLKECRFENRKAVDKLKIVNVVRKGLTNLVVAKDENGKMTIDETSQIITINTKDKVSAKKVYEFTRLLG